MIGILPEFHIYGTIVLSLPTEIISKMYLIENKEVTLLYKLNR